MSATIPQLRDAAIAALAAALPGVNVAAHGGTFDLEEIRRYATLAPAVRVCIVGCEAASTFNDGRPRLPVHFAAVVITKDAINAGAKVERDVAAVALAGAIQLAVNGNRFGLAGVFRPENLRAKNEYSSSSDSLNVAIWQVNWTSCLLVGEAGDESVTSAIGALSELWINGVAMGSGEEILPDVRTGAPAAPFLPPSPLGDDR
jgi:hypothetical protein